MIGQQLAHYEITGKLGEGGMGVVYRARDGRLKREVAIKLLPEGFASDPERLARFRREAETLASLNHPHIGGIHGLEEDRGHHFLVLELVEGEELGQRMSQGPLPVEEACRLATQVAAGLEAAHARGVVHRDLKPGNIRLDEEGDAKVLDFGLAFQADTDAKGPDDSSEDAATVTSFRQSGAVVGTVPYMSPEQARGRQVDERTDCWAFGVILFEMLTGRPLFHGDTPADAVAAVLGRAIPWDELPAGTPPSLRRLLERCLERDPRQRLRQIGYARLAIEDGLRAPDNRQHTTTTRRPWLPATMGIAALLAGIALGVALFGGNGAAPLPHRKASLVIPTDGQRVRMSQGPQISPDGQAVVYVADDQLWMWELDALEPRRLEGTEGAVGPFWSPDGEQLGYVQGRSFHRLPRRGGRAVQMATMPAEIAGTPGGGAGWSESGIVAVGTTYSELMQFPAAGGEVTPLLPLAEGDLDPHSVAALPGGRGWLMVMHRDSGEGHITVLESSGERHDVLDIPGDAFYGITWSPTGHILFGRSGLAEGVWALPFSLSSMEATGEPFVVAPLGTNPSVADDGTLSYMLAPSAPAARIVWVDRRGNEVGGAGVVRTPYPFVEISPEGTRLLVTTGASGAREAHAVDLATGRTQRLSFNKRNETTASWGWQGRSIFTSDEADYAIREILLDGESEPRLVGHGFHLQAVPGGEGEVVYARASFEDGFTMGIVRQPAGAGASEAVELLPADQFAWHPRVSPDGRYMLFSSNDSGTETVFLTRYPEGRGRWQISLGAGGSVPRWRGDMGEVYYTTHDSIYAVPVELGDPVRVGRPRALFERPRMGWSATWPDGYDVAPDGERFIMLRTAPEEDPPRRVVVVQNWFAEFAGAQR